MTHAADEQPADQWRPCEPGELSALGGGRPLNRRRLALAGVGMAIMLCVTAIALVLQPSHAPSAEINCRDCKKLMHDYADGRLSRRVEHQVERHLARCDHCRKSYEQANP